MGQSLATIYLHIVFSTLRGQPFIDEPIRDRLFRFIGKLCHDYACQPVAIGGYRDHIHILCRFSKKITLITFMEKVKLKSSKWAKTQGKQYQNFYWQDGYAAFSINHRQVKQLVKIINCQPEYHQHKNLSDELNELDKVHNLGFDPSFFLR